MIYSITITEGGMKEPLPQKWYTLSKGEGEQSKAVVSATTLTRILEDANFSNEAVKHEISARLPWKDTMAVIKTVLEYRRNLK